MIVFLDHSQRIAFYFTRIKLFVLRDPRFDAITSLIKNQSLKGFGEIFSIIPVSVVKDELKVNYNTLRNRINNVHLLTVNDINNLAEVFKTQPAEIFALILLDLKSNTKKKSGEVHLKIKK